MKLHLFHLGITANRPIGGYDHHVKQCSCGKIKGDFSPDKWVTETEYNRLMNKKTEQ